MTTFEVVSLRDVRIALSLTGTGGAKVRRCIEFAGQFEAVQAGNSCRTMERPPVRVMNQLAPTRAEIGQVIQAPTELREAVRAEGLDRPIARPETRKPSVEDLELLAWELVVGPDGLSAEPR